MRIFLLHIIWVILLPAGSKGQAATALAQFPSPMQENLRRHERIKLQADRGTRIPLELLPGAHLMVYLPQHFRIQKRADILVHFHGGGDPVYYAAEQYRGNLMVITVGLGTGSGIYSRTFGSDSLFQTLLTACLEAIRIKMGRKPVTGRLFVSGFSAGYGAVRSLLRQPAFFRQVDGILLLDGLHASYVPERRLLAEGGGIDTAAMQPFVDFARAAATGDKRFLFTHSAIFPGTFLSTTEAAGYLISALQLKAMPVLQWGPGGMQQLSEARAGACQILGFAGNTAPDHMEHLHGLYDFLNRL